MEPRRAWILVLVPLLLSIQQKAKTAPPKADDLDLAHELGVPVEGLRERTKELGADARKEVAAHVGCPPSELAGVRLFAGATRAKDGASQPCGFVALPLAGPAKGARLTFSAFDGRAHEMGLWGALDFDADPSGRWGIFIEQLRVAGTQETGKVVGPVTLAGKPARALDELVRGLEKPADDSQRLAQVLLRQRLDMRRNGFWLALSRRGSTGPAVWLEGLARDGKELAEHAGELEPLLGPGSAERFAETALELAGAFEDAHALAADGGAAAEDAKALEKRTLESCRGCHASKGADGRKWPELVAARRAELGLGETALRVGLDIVAAPGDDQGVSQEIATKVKAGLLLLETLGS